MLLSAKNENPRCDTKNTSNGSYTLASKGVAALPPERSPDASTACGGLTARKIRPFQLKRKIRRENLKNNARDGFFWRGSVLTAR